MSRIPNRLLPVVICISIAICGCDRAAGPSRTTAPAAVEASWAEQVSAVRKGDSSAIHVTTSPVSAEQLRELAEGCQAIAQIDIETLEAPQASLSILATLPKLRQLRIGSPVEDTGLREIAHIDSLRVLNLPHGQFTDAGLAELAALPRLELLRFHSPHVTDEGMKRIAVLPALRFLHLINVPITDTGLTHLEGLDKLESFYLDGGRCTEDGLRRLLDRRPNLHFHYNQLHLPDDPHAHPHDHVDG